MGRRVCGEACFWLADLLWACLEFLLALPGRWPPLSGWERDSTAVTTVHHGHRSVCPSGSSVCAAGPVLRVLQQRRWDRAQRGQSGVPRRALSGQHSVADSTARCVTLAVAQPLCAAVSAQHMGVLLVFTTRGCCEGYIKAPAAPSLADSEHSALLWGVARSRERAREDARAPGGELPGPWRPPAPSEARPKRAPHSQFSCSQQKRSLWLSEADASLFFSDPKRRTRGHGGGSGEFTCLLLTSSSCVRLGTWG